MPTTLICDCNQTMPLEPRALGQALSEELTLHSTLCRREAPAFQRAIKSGDEVLVACTQEKRLFGALGSETEGAVSPVRFVNIRETGGWSRDAAQAGPKIAALLAAAHLPEPEPVPTVSYKSGGRLLIIGPLDEAEACAEALADVLQPTLFARGPGRQAPAQQRRHPVLSGEIRQLSGWLGAFRLRWRKSNPIDLDLCTRCNACVAACPEQAIGLDYQIDLSRCRSHRDCVAACGAAGAIDFGRAAVEVEDDFDLVLDLGAAPLIDWHAPPQGYLAPGADRQRRLDAMLRLRERVGEFDKPRFFAYKPALCAHSRNEQVGCKACVEVCSAQAVRSEASLQRIAVNPHLCVGCGACTTVCPSGALTYAYPRAPDQGLRIKTLLSTYLKAGGRQPVLLLHSQTGGQALIEQLGREARLGRAHGLPAQVIPLPLWHGASTGIDLWLSAVAYGASQVLVLATHEEAPGYLRVLREQMALAQAVLSGLGYRGAHLHLLEMTAAPALDAALQALRTSRGDVPAAPARHAVAAEKRASLELAIEHLAAQSPLAASLPEALPLPAAGAPFGSLAIDRERCTLCLSCVSACPASALQDNPERPQLRFIEKNCVQCGLCASTCPEDAITLLPRLLLTPERKQPRVLNETPPYQCVRCAKPFGTLKAVEAMLGKLAGHAMFQGAAAERLKMCADCRVIDLYSASDETRITDL